MIRRWMLKSRKIRKPKKHNKRPKKSIFGGLKVTKVKKELKDDQEPLLC